MLQSCRPQASQLRCQCLEYTSISGEVSIPTSGSPHLHPDQESLAISCDRAGMHILPMLSIVIPFCLYVYHPAMLS